MKQKDIYLANLDPSVGSEQAGRRPVVIISGNTMNDNLGVSITCPISGSIKGYPSCVVIKKNKTNNLKTDSEVIVFQIRTVSKNRFYRKIGKISDIEFMQILQGLSDALSY